MRLFLAIIIAAFSISSLAFSSEFDRLFLGPSLGVKAGLNGAPSLEGRKNGMAFCGIPEIGMNALYWLSDSSDLAINFDISYSSYAFEQKSWAGNLSFPQRYSYLKLGADFYFSQFLAGFGVGFPLNGDIEGNKIDKSILNTIAEIRLAGWFPVMSDETGTLNIFVQASYMLNGIFDDYPKNDPLLNQLPPSPPYSVTEKYNPRAVSLSIGFNYLFGLSF
ncbi:MAG: hypothetical protein GX121_07365 [Ignavibacteria bacterium]|jgi:hypothetical protein|nr:hypothetical protein [Ignavibacteria bacterium]